METDFETFSELMTEKESLLDEDLDNLDVCTKRQSLESEFEAYSVVLEERKSHKSEEMVHQKVLAKTLEMASHFEPFTELMEGEEALLRESLEQRNLDSKTELASSGNHLGVRPIPELETSAILDSLPANRIPSTSILEDISHQLVGLITEARTKESSSLSESSELNLSGLDILGTTEAGARETFSRGSEEKDSVLTNGDIALINEQGHYGVVNTDSETKKNTEFSVSHSVEKVLTFLDRDLASTEGSTEKLISEVQVV